MKNSHEKVKTTGLMEINEGRIHSKIICQTYSSNAAKQNTGDNIDTRGKHHRFVRLTWILRHACKLPEHMGWRRGKQLRQVRGNNGQV